MARPSLRTFTAAERGGQWSVTCDGVFYGDYNTQQQAVASAKAGARAVEGRGGTACVLVGVGRLAVPH